MLTRLKFENYRAFSKGEFRIRPITIFVGANSVGKTSALQLPLILKQTASVGERAYKAALKIHGREVNIGDPRNFFFQQNTSQPFTLEIDFQSDRLAGELRDNYFSDLTSVIYGTIEFYHYVLTSQSNLPKPTAKLLKSFRPPTNDNPYNEAELKDLLALIETTANVAKSLKPSDLPLNFHPAAVRASANVTPFDAVSVPA